MLLIMGLKTTNNRVKVARKQRGLGPRYSLGPLPKR
jgi:hypothetical protein